jgi:hypothetical protein
VENVIGKMKRRFKVLGNLSMDVEKVPKVIFACGVLYNIYLSLDLFDLDDLFEGQATVDDSFGDEGSGSGF